MRFLSVTETEYPLIHSLMNDYYREGEDSQTSQDEIDGFIQYLYDLCLQGKIMGAVAFETTPVGFVIWNIDTPEGAFCQKPGFGTILEIGINREFRHRGFGRKIAEYALSMIAVLDYYVCAYGPAEAFWTKYGFRDSGEIAENGLKIYVRHDHGFEG